MLFKKQFFRIKIGLLKIIFVSVFFLANNFLSRAQNILRLPDAINIALKNNLDIQLSKITVETNDINNNYGVAGGLPLVTGSASNNEQISNINQKYNTGSNTIKNGASTNSTAASVNGSILLYNGGRVLATKQRLAEITQQSQQQLNAQIQNILANVMSNYYDIVRQQSYSKTLEKSIDAAKKKLEIVQTRQQVGLANNADLFQSQLDLNELLQAQQSQILVVNQAKTSLLRLLVLNSDSSVYIQDTILVDKNIQLKNIQNTLLSNPNIIAADEQIKINLLVVKETQALRYPSLKANTGFSFSRTNATAGQLLLNQSYGPTAGITLGIPIYNGSVYKRQKQTAQLNVKVATLQKQNLLNDYDAQIINLHQTYTNAIAQLDVEQKNYKLSEELLDLILQKFQLKAATIVDVKNAQQSFEASGYRLVNLSYTAKLAEIGLKQLANQLGL